MRIATALFFAALVCVAQAQFFSVLTSGLTSGLTASLGQTAKVAKDKIKELTTTIDETLEKAEEKLQSTYKQAREKVEGAYELVQDAADKVLDGVKGAVNRIEDSIQERVDKLAENVLGEDVDVSSCTGLVQTFGNVADAVLNDTGACVTDKLQQGKDIVSDVLDKGQESLDVITGIRIKSKECTENIDGLGHQISAASCLVSVGTKATWALTTKVPGVGMDFTEAVALIQTLPASLSTCASTNSLTAVVKQGTAVVSDVKKCITDRIEAVKGTKTNDTA